RVTLSDLGRIRLEARSIDPARRWDMEMVRRYIENLKEEGGIELLVLDSLTGYLTIMEQTGDPKAGDGRMALFEFFDWLHRLDVTSFLISEMGADTRAYSRFGSDFLADGVVHLELEVPDNTHARRRIRCVKMRGSDHSLDYYALIYGGGRFRVPSSDVWR
ncbi:MAG: hypothetical protein HY558_08370, partial [Euryarchaeota archaeon]|nr:hypothetical protein [Euryarchaeota archaeon]